MRCGLIACSGGTIACGNLPYLFSSVSIGPLRDPDLNLIEIASYDN